MSTMPDVRVGQVWADCDKRAHGRTFRVVDICQGGRGCDTQDRHYAICKILTNSSIAEQYHLGDARGRRVRIRADRFRPTSKGYRLVEDAPAAGYHAVDIGKGMESCER